MKPRIYWKRGRWWCGLPGEPLIYSATADKPDEALRLWHRARGGRK